MLIEGRESIGSKVIHENGSFQLVEVYFEGWVHFVTIKGRVRFVDDGFRGKETLVTMTRIVPSKNVLIQ